MKTLNGHENKTYLAENNFVLLFGKRVKDVTELNEG